MMDSPPIAALPSLGAGLACSGRIVEDIFDSVSRIDFVEVIIEHYLDAHPARTAELLRLSARYPIVCHGVDMSVGTAEPLDEIALRRKAQVVVESKALWFSDHLCFTKAHGIDIGQLTPLPFSDESIEIVTNNVRAIKACIPVPFLLENIAYYFTIPGSTMSEAEFIRRVVESADCGLLLDLTNLYTNAINHGYDPFAFLRSIPLERVVEIHVAGGSWMESVLIDSHSAEVPAPVWDLLGFVVRRSAVKGVVLERDENIPSLEELSRELEIARRVMASRNDAPVPDHARSVGSADAGASD